MHRVVIVGAGTFGASLAWLLARAGSEVVLVDQFTPGDARASSGGESRLLRCAHGTRSAYTRTAWRARTLWRELEAECGAELLVECGVAWFARREDGWEARSERVLHEHAIPARRLDVADAAAILPGLRGDDLAFVLLEPEAGVLRAASAVRALVAGAQAHGARLVRARARPDGGAAVLSCGERLSGDAVVWACGAWLGRLFPEHLSLATTVQELLFLRGGPAWRTPGVPAWVDDEAMVYGTGDLDGLGVKAALDEVGPDLSPDAPLPAGGRTEARVRAYLAGRFPALAEAPLLRTTTCRYELTPDSHFVVARHPEAAGGWLLGGGSGQGFKHGPAVAEMLVEALLGDAALPAHFALDGRRPGDGR